MTETVVRNETLDERLHTNELSSGIKCYIIPKNNYLEKQAVLAVHYGSVDFRYQLDGQETTAPEGIAHFLEHKLFENKELNVFDQFTRQGASVNAFTNLTGTAYYFNCIDAFDANFKLLLNFTQQPYFTDENVEKEKGIITQEINMYKDNPHWRIYINLLNALYHRSPVRKDIAGTVESIQRITADLLYEAYDTFYYPSNMALICVGEFDHAHLYETAEKLIKPRPQKKITRLYGHEPSPVRESYIEEKMAVSMPMFDIGFKEDLFNEPIADRLAASKILTDILAGPSSDLYEKLYQDGLIDDSFSADYMGGTFYGVSIFAGMSKDPRRVSAALDDEIAKQQREGIDPQRFETIKRKHTGRLIRGFNSIDRIASGQADLFTSGISLFDMMESYDRITLEYVQKRLGEHYRADNQSLSVVLPQ